MTNNLAIFFNEHYLLVKKARKQIPKANRPLNKVLLPMSFAITDSCESLLNLYKGSYIRDCYVIARTILETIINICYIVSGGNEVAEKASRHAEQKIVRDLQRNSTIGNQTISIKWQGDLDVDSNKDLKSALDEFTSKTGREKTNWSDKSIAERLEVINAKMDNKVSDSLQFALFGIYRHASDITHGTLFGSLFAIGMTTPGVHIKSGEELQRHYNQLFTMIFLLLSGSIKSLLIALETEYELGDLIKKSKELFTEIQKEEWVE